LFSSLLDLLQPAVRDAFVRALVGTLHEALGSPVAVPSIQTQEQA